MTRCPGATPLAWAYACIRMEARSASARYQNAEAFRLRLRAAREYHLALQAGGAEAEVVRLVRQVIETGPRHLNDPGAVFLHLPEPAALAAEALPAAA